MNTTPDRATCGAVRDVLPCTLDADHGGQFHEDSNGYRWPTAAAMAQAAEDLRPAGLAALLDHIAANLPDEDQPAAERCENCGHAPHGHAEHLTNPSALTDCPHCPCAAELREMSGEDTPADDEQPAEPTDRLIVLDGRDALAFVVIRAADEDPERIAVEASARGMSKAVAAYALRQTADEFDRAALAEGDEPITAEEAAAEQQQRAGQGPALDRAQVRAAATEPAAADRADVETLRARVAELEKRIETALADHTPFDDSRHCQHDGEPWPCPTVTTLAPEAYPPVTVEAQRLDPDDEALESAMAAGIYDDAEAQQ